MTGHGHEDSILKTYHFDEEHAETHQGYEEPTGFPAPIYRYRINIEAINQFVEDAYFWTIDELRQAWSFNKFHKITDVFAASEQSAFFGVSEQRLGAQQDRAAQFLRGISEMTKSLFQLVRELRIIDERLGFYEHTFNRKVDTEEAVGSEITLKGVWVDQVEGGAKNAGSVYGLANTVGFTTLPDLFFRIRADDRGAEKKKELEFDTAIKTISDDIDKKVDAMEGFNEKVKEVLKRKLTQYYVWKLRTYKELQTRRNFTIKYLKQHYETIRLYMGWVKPYLRNIRRLQLDEKQMDSTELIGAFEGATMEIEVMAIKQRPGHAYHPVMICHWFYRTRPALNYQQEGYQRGPAHTGQFDLTLRSYVWSEAEIENYKRMRAAEDLELLKSINDSIKDAMESLGDDLKKYLDEQNYKERMEAEAKAAKAKHKPSLFAPITDVTKGFKELFGSLAKAPQIFKSGKKKDSLGNPIHLEEEIEVATSEIKTISYQVYKNYKKLHGMLTW